MTGTVVRLLGVIVEAQMDDPINGIVPTLRFQVYRQTGDQITVILVGTASRALSNNIRILPVTNGVFGSVQVGDLVRSV